MSSVMEPTDAESADGQTGYPSPTTTLSSRELRTLMAVCPALPGRGGEGAGRRDIPPCLVPGTAVLDFTTGRFPMCTRYPGSYDTPGTVYSAVEHGYWRTWINLQVYPLVI